MLSIQYISDIHLEFRYNLPKIKALADILVLAGDIGDPRSKIYKWFLSDVSSKFKKYFLFVVIMNIMGQTLSRRISLFVISW